VTCSLYVRDGRFLGKGAGYEQGKMVSGTNMAILYEADEGLGTGYTVRDVCRNRNRLKFD